MNSLDTVFSQLRQIMLNAAPTQVIASDEPGNLVLHTGQLDSKTGKPDWFGAVQVKKNYVAYHLIPLYNDPSLGAEISEGLFRRRQGKSCFNFKSIDAALFAELADLTSKMNDGRG